MKVLARVADVPGGRSRESAREGRAVFDSAPRLGRDEAGAGGARHPRAAAGEKDLPKDWPPARLASVFKNLGRLDGALAANDRALALVQGARQALVLSTRVDILCRAEDSATATNAGGGHRLRQDAARRAVSARQVKGLEKKLTGLRRQPRLAEK